MTWKDGWPFCDGCLTGIRYEAVYTVDDKDYCVWCVPQIWQESLDKSRPEE